jgi:hypothetical protein
MPCGFTIGPTLIDRVSARLSMPPTRVTHRRLSTSQSSNSPRVGPACSDHVKCRLWAGQLEELPRFALLFVTLGFCLGFGLGLGDVLRLSSRSFGSGASCSLGS